MITLAALVASGVHPTQARIFVEPLQAACMRFELHTSSRQAAFLGQVIVESSGFKALEEGLYYTDPARIQRIFSGSVPNIAVAQSLARNPKALANHVYAGRNGNRGKESGDGWNYRGRGLIQLTGRANYADASIGLARKYLERPELVAQPEDACLTAALFFHSRKLQLLADAWLIDEITRAVNGRAMLHADERRQYSEQALRALHKPTTEGST